MKAMTTGWLCACGVEKCFILNSFYYRVLSDLMLKYLKKL
ncbi:hypothetical protein A0R60_0479 [Enterobacter asburiae]|nr:hypothetical protein A0R60_0479 [Enterobacter asburiae]